jgi:hypothetical protein
VAGLIDYVTQPIERRVDTFVRSLLVGGAIAALAIAAAGFAIAAVTVLLSQSFGPVAALAMVAAGFAVSAAGVAIVARFTVWREADENQTSAEEVKSEEAFAEAPQDRASLLGVVERGLADREFAKTMVSALLPVAVPLALRGVVRNAPALVLMSVLAWLGWRLFASGDDASAAIKTPRT